MSREIQIAQLRAKRAFWDRLGKRDRVKKIDAKLQPLVLEELNCETVAAEMERDLAIVAGGVS